MDKEKAVFGQTAGTTNVQKHYNIPEAVKDYKALNLPILPVKPLSKEPLIKWKDPEKRSKAYFKDNDNIGMICGSPWNGGYLVAFDFDNSDRNRFDQFVEELEKNEIPGIIQKSGGQHEGFHYIIKTEKPFKNSNAKIEGFEDVEIDIKGDGYILIEPSIVKAHYKLEGSFEELQTVPKEHIEKFLKALTESRVQASTYNCIEDIFNTVVGTYSEKLILSGFPELFTTTKVWDRLFEHFGHSDLTPCTLNKPFRSLPKIHDKKEDKHPSASLFAGENGSIIYQEFSQNRIYRLEEVYHILTTGQSIAKIRERRTELLSRWTAEMIDELNIFTKASIEFTENFNELIEKEKSTVPERFKKVWRVIAGKMERAYDHGGDIFTARWLSTESGINDHKIANQALNVLCAIGVLKKTIEKNLQTGKTNKIEPLIFDVGDALILLQRLESYLKEHGGWMKFSRKAVEKTIGKYRSEEIFTRDRD